MGGLRKLKAYFGMIPADEVDDYDDIDEHYSDRRGYYPGDYGADDLDGYPERRRPFGGRPGYRDDPIEPQRDRVASRRWNTNQAPVHGALAVDPHVEPISSVRPLSEPAYSAQENPLSRITTLHLRSYNEARMIGEPYRDGIPVIMNLTEMEDADAKRLVDFAAGLAFALRGSIEKVTSRVFLISPPNVDVTAEDKRRMAEGGFFGRS